MKELLEIGKLLEAKRDLYVELSDSDFVHNVLFLQLNAFFSNFILSIEDAEEINHSSNDSKNCYIIYSRVKHTSIRYLFELYLTMAHMLNHSDPYNAALSLALSQQVKLHKINLQLDDSRQNVDSLKALDHGRENYTHVVKKLERKWASLLPHSIDELSNDTNWSKYNLKYWKNAKIEYKHEIENNPLIFKSSSQVLPTDTIQRLTHIYSMLSLNSHPTFATLEELNTFITKEQPDKVEFINKTKQFNGTILRVIGKAMYNLINLNQL